MELLQLLSESVGDPKVGFLIATVIGYCLYKVMLYMGRRKAAEFESQQYTVPNEALADSNFKLALIVRTDLKMGKGKAAAQCAHAAVGAYKAAMKVPRVLQAWEESGQAKITLKVGSETALLGIAKHARSKGILCYMVHDAGRTQIAAGSRTVCAVGPGPSLLLDTVTGHLKLY